MEENLEDIIKKGAVIIDVRTKEEYDEDHIKGSLNIPLNEIEKAMTWLIKDVPLVVCCASGSRSAVAKKILETSGFKRVYNGGCWSDIGKMKIGGSCPVE